MEHLHDENLVKIVIDYYKSVKYSVFLCDGCGYAIGHKLVWCPKCGTNLKERRSVTAYDLGLVNKESIFWNDWTTIYAIARITKSELMGYNEFKELVLSIFNK